MKTIPADKLSATLIQSLYEKYVVPSYMKNGIVAVRGEGSRIWDAGGKEYLDLYPGWGSNPLGHAPEELRETIQRQAETLLHIPNNYYHPWQGLLAEKLVQLSFPGKCFFANSGAEANEGAIKCARLFGHEKGRFEIITFKQSFHGRTLATLTATGQEKVQKGFAPLLEGFHYADFNDLESVRRLISEKTCAVMLEPVQGEGGVYPADKSFLTGLRQLCDESGLLLIFDEVQTGIGRTGTFFGFQQYGVVPDIMTLAKSLGGGIPIGAFIARPGAADKLQPGTHASTFGGAPFASAVSLKVIEEVEKQNLLDQVNRLSQKAFHRLNELKKECQVITEVRGAGFLIGIEVSCDLPLLIEQCAEKGVLVNRAGTNVLRIMPALNISESELFKGIEIVEEVLKNA